MRSPSRGPVPSSAPRDHCRRDQDRHLRAWVGRPQVARPAVLQRSGAAAAAAGHADLAGHQPLRGRRDRARRRGAGLARLAGPGLRGVPGLCGRRGPAGRGAPAAQPSTRRTRRSTGCPRRPADTIYGYTERQLLFHQVDALVTLGDCRGADDAFGQAMRLYSPASSSTARSSRSGGRAAGSSGEPEEALRLGRDTLLALPSQHHPRHRAAAARSLGEAVTAKHGDLPGDAGHQRCWSAASSSPSARPGTSACRADSVTVRLTARAPWPTSRSGRSRIGVVQVGADVACCRAAHIFHACAGSTGCRCRTR